jgi:hypothetical protein
MDRLIGRHRALDGVEKADEFLMLIVAQRPFFIGSPGWVRSRGWIWLFSAMLSTMAWAGGSI